MVVPNRGPGLDVKHQRMDSALPADNLYPMSEAREVATDAGLSQADLAWLDARLEEYRDLLQYLRDH
jgi:hypothetical protein